MIDAATHLVILREGTTVLCAAHANAMQLITQAAEVECDIYILPDDEEPIRCQACLLAEVNPDRHQLPH
jgi:hypothetical protein